MGKIKGILTFDNVSIEYDSEEINEHNSILKLEKEIVFNEWVICRKMEMYFHTSQYPHDHRAYIEFTLRDRMDISRSFRIYARYLSKTWPEALQELDKLSEYKYSNWEEYDKETESLLRTINLHAEFLQQSAKPAVGTGTRRHIDEIYLLKVNIDKYYKHINAALYLQWPQIYCDFQTGS